MDLIPKYNQVNTKSRFYKIKLVGLINNHKIIQEKEKAYQVANLINN